MRRTSWLISLGLIVGLACLAGPRVRGGILYNPVVTMVGDSTSSVSGQGRTTTIRIYQNTTANQAAPISALSFNSGATGTRLVNTINIPTEAMLSNNPALVDAAAAGNSYSGSAYVFSGGYDAANQALTASANRVVGYMSVDNNTVSNANIPFSQTSSTAYDSSNIRSATGDDTATKFWTGGDASTAANSGWRYFDTNTRMTTSVTNVRGVELHNGQLFGSTAATNGANAHGLYAIGTGEPITSGQTIKFMIDTTSHGGNSDEFVLIDDPNNNADTSTTFGYDTAYIADDSSAASAGGIQKYTWNGTAWAYQYSLSDGSGGDRGLAGQLDPSTNKVVLWTTSSDGSKLYQFTDNGSGPGTFITLATAPANDLFRGVALAPVPEPASLGIAALLLPLLAARRRRFAPRAHQSCSSICRAL